jgi:alpha-1,3-rhamnosyltransferase
MQVGSEFESGQPLVTVVISSYNHEKYVSQSIESVVAQSYENIEIIVIDDGSKDQSVQIIASLAKKHGFTVIARENRGLARTLNEGIGLARGTYISFVASDDYYFPHRIGNAVRQLEKSTDKVAFVYCDGYIIDDAGQRIGLFGDRHPRPLVGSIYDNLLVGNWIPGMGVTFKAEVLKQFKFDERFMIEDHTLFLRMFKDDKHELVFYNDLGFAYRWHGNNISKPGELMDIENRLIEYYFEDVGRYAEFKRLLKNRSFAGIKVAEWKNYYLLCLHLSRLCRKKLA